MLEPGLPTAIGSYTVERVLGRGAMGVVLLARDNRLGRRVAIKTLPGEFATDPKRRARFEQESRVLASLSHPNVLAIFGVEEDHGALHLVLEFADGPTLAERIAPSPTAAATPLPVPELLKVGPQIAAGLAAAHRAGIVHRDLKPENVKLRSDGVVKILDFGLAAATSAQGLGLPLDAGSSATGTLSHRPASDTPTVAIALTQAGEFLGTPGYMSPEQVRTTGVGAPTDVWAFGCVLYECLAGVPAFRGDSHADIIAATLTGQPPMDLVPGETPEELVDLICACLAKDQARRPSAEETLTRLEELRAALSDVGGGSTSRRGAGKFDAGKSGTAKAKPVAEFGPFVGLPPDSSPFSGRARELSAIAVALASTRHVTLSSPDGVGASRLALRAAGNVIDAAKRCGRTVTPIFAEIPARGEAAMIARGIAFAFGCRRESPADGLARVCERAAELDALLVVDSGRASPAATADACDLLLRSCPKLQIIALSREALGISGERELTVAGLSAPAPGPGVTGLDAAGVLWKDATASPGFTANAEAATMIATLAHEVRGLATPLNLIGARFASTLPIKVAEAVRQRLRLNSGGGTLGADGLTRVIVDWALEPLSASQREVLTRLAVFPAGATLRGLAAVCGVEDSMPQTTQDSVAGPAMSSAESRLLPIIKELESRRLLAVRAANTDRPELTRMTLGEPVRTAALAASDVTQAARGRFVRYYAAFAELAGAKLAGPGRRTWIEAMDREQMNLIEAASLAGVGTDDASRQKLEIAMSVYWGG
jgi:serine/threonine protein kinase